ncbi:MAG: hypothetical protein RIC95_01740 [Vicingaceae bacterium]
MRLVLLSLVLLSTFYACKKDVPPSLLVTVVDDLNNRIPRAWVEVSVDGAEGGILNENVVDSAFTDGFGNVTFKFDNTVLVDVALYKNQNSTVKEDSTSVLLETERSIDDDNLIEKKLVIRTLP